MQRGADRHFATVSPEDVSASLCDLHSTLGVIFMLGAILPAAGHMEAPGQYRSEGGGPNSLPARGAHWLCCFRALNLGGAAGSAPFDALGVALFAGLAVMVPEERLSCPPGLEAP